MYVNRSLWTSSTAEISWVFFRSVIFFFFNGSSFAAVLVYRKKERLRKWSVLFAAKNLFQGLGDIDKNVLSNRAIIFGNC